MVLSQIMHAKSSITVHTITKNAVLQNFDYILLHEANCVQMSYPNTGTECSAYNLRRFCPWKTTEIILKFVRLLWGNDKAYKVIAKYISG